MSAGASGNGTANEPARNCTFVGVPFAGARLANLLEDPRAQLAIEGGAIVVPYRPFQILTVLVAQPA